MNLLHLEYFYYVAKEGGFLRAAEKLRIQQPAISRMVASLEDYFGFKLFEKIGRNVRLTPQGEEVFESCKKIFSDVEELKQSVGKISGEHKGSLLIGASEPIASHYLPPKIAALVKQHPKLYPNIYSGPASILLKKIENGDLEVGIFFHIPTLSEKLIIDCKIDVDFRLVVRRDLCKDESVLNHFIGSREIDDLSTKSFPTLDRLRQKYPKASIKTSSNNLTAHRALVISGVGVSVLPKFLIEEDLKKKILIDVFPGQNFVFQMKIIKRRHAILSLNASSLIKNLNSHHEP